LSRGPGKCAQRRSRSGFGPRTREPFCIHFLSPSPISSSLSLSIDYASTRPASLGTMKPRLSLILCSCFLLSPHLFQTGHSATVEYDFSITWVWATPDGTTGRPVIGINGQWPLPRIEATVGDTVVVRTLNLLGNQSTSLHFHGLFMNGSSLMDGTSHVTQCAIQPGARFTYTFSVR